MTDPNTVLALVVQHAMAHPELCVSRDAVLAMGSTCHHWNYREYTAKDGVLDSDDHFSTRCR